MLSEWAKFLGVRKAINKQLFVKSLLSSCARRVSRCWNTQFYAWGAGGSLLWPGNTQLMLTGFEAGSGAN